MDAELRRWGERVLGEMEERLGLPRPDWGAVARRWDGVPEEARGAVWSAVELVWQERLAAAWGEGFGVRVEGERLLTTDLPTGEAAAVMGAVDRSLATIDRALAGLGLFEDGGVTPGSEAAGYDVVIVCRRVEDYLDYVADLDGPEHVGAVSGGVCVRGGGAVHVVAHGREGEALRGVLAHELAHARLAEMELPVWLEEGLVTHLENAVVPSEAYAPNMQTVAMHRGFWTPRRLDGFFSGEAFCGEDDADGLPYRLAYTVVGNLMAEDREAFVDLLATATWEDCGASACREVYGRELGEMVPRFVRAAAEKNDTGGEEG
ncbi:MAG: hypothetical protein AAFX76_10000 [Planctomycetota bacterium]